MRGKIMEKQNAKAGLLLTFAALLGISHAAKSDAVTGFNATRFLGTWYEIARMPTPFEKDMVKVTATYSALPNGNIRVLNAGEKNGKATSAKGTARFATPDKTRGALEVSFFGPFYAEYTIVALDPEYQYTMVISGKEYLWILCRAPKLETATLERLIAQARGLGYNVDKLIMVAQN